MEVCEVVVWVHSDGAEQIFNVGLVPSLNTSFQLSIQLHDSIEGLSQKIVSITLHYITSFITV